MTDPPQTPHTSLSLGTLFHDLRGGMGDSGGARVSIRFEQRASQGGRDQPVPTLVTRSSLVAELDYADGSLRRADMMASGNQMPQALRVTFLENDSSYLYSIDGARFGRFAGPVVIFDVGSFEELLSFIQVQDVTIDERPDPRGTSLDVLSVVLDQDGFRRLLRVFGSDTEETPEEFDLDSYSVNFTSGGDLIVDYWWQLSGEETTPADRDQPVPTTVNCHVTIRLVAASPQFPSAFDMGADLPLLRRVDDVWDLARARARDNDC